MENYFDEFEDYLKCETNCLSFCEGEDRPVYEQTLLMHLDELLNYRQRSELTVEEKHHAYHVAYAIFIMFIMHDRPIPQHYVEWISETSYEMMKGGM